ncbi:MAG: Uma2 family endonuclease [Myxococcales bacterium]|nr:Uma2 family endonuclease [Myxococcales bacterium]
MAGQPAKRLATYADLESVPEHQQGEIIGGELIVSPRPRGRATVSASHLGGILIGPFRFGVGGPGGWVILYEPEIRIAGELAIPDLAGWRRERMPVVPETFEMAPDWACEILSPSTEALDRGEKMPLYARWGVGHSWLIDASLKTIEVFRLDGGSWRVVGTFVGERKVRLEPFEAIELDLSLLWAI